MDVSAHFSALDDEEFFVIEGSGWRGRRELAPRCSATQLGALRRDPGQTRRALNHLNHTHHTHHTHHTPTDTTTHSRTTTHTTHTTHSTQHTPRNTQHATHNAQRSTHTPHHTTHYTHHTAHTTHKTNNTHHHTPHHQRMCTHADAHRDESKDGSRSASKDPAKDSPGDHLFWPTRIGTHKSTHSMQHVLSPASTLDAVRAIPITGSTVVSSFWTTDRLRNGLRLQVKRKSPLSPQGIGLVVLLVLQEPTRAASPAFCCCCVGGRCANIEGRAASWDNSGCENHRVL